MADGSPAPAPQSRVRRKTPKGDPIALFNAQLDGIETAEREEKFRRWSEIFDLTEDFPTVAGRLRTLALKPPRETSRYRRFVIAAQVGGFGLPTRLGPNSLGQTSMKWWLSLMRGFPVGGKTRRLEATPAVEALSVTVPPNDANDRRFQEILWYVLEHYPLDFRTKEDGTFWIFSKEPPP